MKKLLGIFILATVLCTTTIFSVGAVPETETSQTSSVTTEENVSEEDGAEEDSIEDDGEDDFLLTTSESENILDDTDILDDADTLVTTGSVNDRLVDEADILSDSEEETLRNKLDEISERVKCDVVVVTVDSLDGKTAQAYADDYFDYNGYGYGSNHDGALLLMAKNDRKWAISTCGYGITALTDRKLENMADEFTPYLSKKKYNQAFNIYANMCDQYISQARNTKTTNGKEPYNVGKSLLISLGVGVVIAIIAVMAMASQLKSVKLQQSAVNYIKQGSLRVNQRHDVFLYRNVTQERKPDDDDHHSTTHTSSSGRTHGGASGSF